MPIKQAKKPAKRRTALALTVVFALLAGLFFEAEVFILQTLNFDLYWQVGIGFFLLMLLFVLGVYGHSFLHVERNLGMDTRNMRIKRILHYLLHYFTLPTILYFSLLTVLFYTSSAGLQHLAVWLSVFAFFSVLICVLKVVRCAPKGYKLPDRKKMHYYYICRVKFCFFYKLFVAFLALTALYQLSIERLLPVAALPFAVAAAVYVLLMHNMMFLVNWEWKTQKKALLFAAAIGLLALGTRLGRVHFLISGVVLVTFYHIFEGLFFHKLNSLKKEILQKYFLMGALALLVLLGSFDLDIGGRVAVPDEANSKIGEIGTFMPAYGLEFLTAASILTVIFITAYLFLFRKAVKTRVDSN